MSDSDKLNPTGVNEKVEEEEIRVLERSFENVKFKKKRKFFKRKKPGNPKSEPSLDESSVVKFKKPKKEISVQGALFRIMTISID
jgi:hypothetical protein